MPFAFFLGRLCEHFGCLPSEAYREWLASPAGLLEEIIEAMTYADAKQVYERAAKKSDIPASPVMDLVKEIDFELVTEAWQDS